MLSKVVTKLIQVEGCGWYDMIDQGCFPTFLVTTELQCLIVTTRVTSSSHHLLHCGPIAATGPVLAVQLLSAGPVRKLPLPQRVLQLFPISWRTPSASSYLPLSKQKLQGDETAFSFTGGNRSSFHCSQKPSISLLPLGRDNSVYVPWQPHA